MLLLEHAPRALNDGVVVRGDDPEPAVALRLARPKDGAADRLLTLLCASEWDHGSHDALGESMYLSNTICICSRGAASPSSICTVSLISASERTVAKVPPETAAPVACMLVRTRAIWRDLPVARSISRAAVTSVRLRR